MEQSIGNACGTIAVVHSILNNLDTITLQPGSLLEKYILLLKALFCCSQILLIWKISHSGHFVVAC
jgi:hypothetical protein